MKYKKSLSFRFSFDVLQHKVTPKTSFGVKNVQLEGLTKVLFEGDGQSATILISNSQLATEFSAKKSGKKTILLFFYQV